MLERTPEEIARLLSEVDYGISTLAETRDLLQKLEDGGEEYFSTEVLAKFGRIAMEEAGGRLEQALYSLGVYTRPGLTPEEGGQFVGEFKGLPGIPPHAIGRG